MPLDISGINFFMPVFSFLFVFIIVYALFAKTKVLGESQFTLLLVSFIIAIIFMSFSSLGLYINTVLPWFVVLFIVVLFIFLIAGFSGNLEAVSKSWFVWLLVVVVVLIFIVSAIHVFNPVFHPKLGITSSDSGSMIEQIGGFFVNSEVAGSILLLVIAGIVAWILGKS